MAPRLGRSAKEARICQNCMKSESEIKLLSCSKCRLCHYCSRDCQVAHWKVHKPQCQLNARTREMLKERLEESPDIVEINRKFKNWQQIHRPLFHHVLCSALNLFDEPEQASKDLLVVELTLNPNTGGHPHASAFLVKMALMFPIDEFLELQPPASRAQLEIAHRDHVAQTARLRKECPGAPGVALVIASLREYHILRMIPAIFPEPVDYRDYDPDWEQTFKDAVAKGERF